MPYPFSGEEIYLLREGLNDNVRALQSVFSGFIAFFVVEITSSVIDALLQRRKQDDTYKKMQEIVENRAEVRYVGQSHAVGEIIREAISGSTHVYNTFMNIGELSKLNEDAERDVVSVYEMHLGGNIGKYWEDIVSANEVHNFRHLRIFPNGRNDHGNHKIHLLRSNMPIINFVIIENRNNDYKEVFFGWVNDGTNSSKIYRSENRNIVDMFWRNFEAMKKWKRGVEWNQEYNLPASQRRPNDDLVVDKAGIWVTKLYDLSDNFVNNGIVKIQFNGGKAIIKGFIVKNGKPPQGIEHDRQIVVDGNKIFFHFSERRGRADGIGLCEYNFRFKNDIEYLHGFVYEHPRGSGRIYGVRVENDYDMSQFNEEFNIIFAERGSDIEKVRFFPT